MLTRILSSRSAHQSPFASITGGASINFLSFSTCHFVNATAECVLNFKLLKFLLFWLFLCVTLFSSNKSTNYTKFFFVAITWLGYYFLLKPSYQTPVQVNQNLKNLSFFIKSGKPFVPYPAHPLYLILPAPRAQWPMRRTYRKLKSVDWYNTSLNVLIKSLWSE